jgi:predicted regulator of Ras-like GTPase activity (Roadblock/LC7/MglB family)
MIGLPELLEEDIRVIDAALDELLRKSDTDVALVIDKGGPLLSQRGKYEQYDTMTMAALAAGAFCATEAIAERVGETNFTSIYQQGDQCSMLVSSIDDSLLLIIIFRADLSAGAIKFYAKLACSKVAAQLQYARSRAPGSILDLVSMNLPSTADIFKKTGTQTPNNPG